MLIIYYIYGGKHDYAHGQKNGLEESRKAEE